MTFFRWLLIGATVVVAYLAWRKFHPGAPTKVGTLDVVTPTSGLTQVTGQAPLPVIHLLPPVPPQPVVSSFQAVGGLKPNVLAAMKLSSALNTVASLPGTSTTTFFKGVG